MLAHLEDAAEESGFGRSPLSLNPAFKRALPEPEHFKDDNNNDNYTDDIKDVSVHVGALYQKSAALTSKSSTVAIDQFRDNQARRACSSVASIRPTVIDRRYSVEILHEYFARLEYSWLKPMPRIARILFGIAALIVLTAQGSLAQTEFAAFWKKFKSAVVAGDKAAVAGMTNFPMSIYESKIDNRAQFLRRYGDIFNGEANGAACFAIAKPQKESTRRYSVYCPFKNTPNDRENAPIRFIFELSKSGWKFVALDNINE